MQKLFLAILLVCASGCVAHGPVYSGSEAISNEEGIVYFYRPSVFYMGGTYPYVFVDGAKKFSLKNNGYNFVKLPPGKHSFEIGKGKTWEFKDLVGEMEIESNKRYYIRVLPKMSNFVPIITPGFSMTSVSGACSVQSIPEGDAIAELKKTRLSR